MRSTIRPLLLAAAAALFAPTSARADGPGDYGYDYPQDPGQMPAQQVGDPAYGGDPSQVYQPPPEGVCFDDDHQAFDCSSDTDFASYSQLDDGYDPSAYQDFRDALSPYGQWVETPQYGQVWVPSQSIVGSDFTPYYSGGRWALSDYGWTWVSEYNWGWAPFHYGRWMNIGNYGWSWIPGRVWGPAWVHWRTGGGYVGWAPLPPRGVRIAPPYGGYAARRAYWNFVPAAQLTSPRLFRVAPSVLPNVWRSTVVSTELRAIGSSRIVFGPPAHSLPIRITPAPLSSFQVALPRANIVVRPGIPLASRPYYAPVVHRPYGGGPGYQPRPYGGGAPGYQPRPSYGGGAPGYQPRPYGNAPGYPRPGSTPPPVYQNPGGPRPGGYQPLPGPQGPGGPRPGGYQPPPMQGPGGPRPGGYQPPPTQQGPGGPRPGGYQPPPTQQGPGGGYQPPPTQQGPGGPRPGGYQPPPAQQGPGGPRPGGYQPAPTTQAPGYPSGGYQPPSTQAPSYPRPGGYQPAPTTQAPSYPRPGNPPPMQQSPGTTQSPVFQRPSYQPPASPAPTPRPSYQAPSYQPRPAPSYSPPPSSFQRPSAPSYSAPSYSRPSAPSPSPSPSFSRPSGPSPSSAPSSPGSFRSAPAYGGRR